MVGSAGLRRALDEAAGWYQLTYQVNRPPDGAVHDLEMKLRRPGVAVKTTRVVTAATSEGQAEARARRLLGGVHEEGELRVDLALGPATAGDDKHLEAEADVTVHFGPLALLMRAGTKLRVSVAVVGGGAEPSVEHREEELKEEAAGWIYSLPVRWSAAAGPGAAASSPIRKT